MRQVALIVRGFAVADLVAEVSRLVERRGQCEREIAEIDNRLSAVRSALGGIMPQRAASHPDHRRALRLGGASTRAAVLKALTACEPLTVNHLKRETAISVSISATVTAMWREGLLLRRLDKRGMVGGGYWYARTEEAFSGHPDCGSSPTQTATPTSGETATEGDGDAAEEG